MRLIFKKRTFLQVSLLIIIFSCLILLVSNLLVIFSTSNNIYEPNQPSSFKADCIIVLGAKVYKSGRLSPILQDRVDVGIKLYFQQAAPKLLLSGDHGQDTYDEVNAMKNYALSKGVPSEDIFLDHAGFSTYESIYRAKKVFNVERAILVSQRFHLYRALFIAKAFNIDSVAYSSALRPYAGNFRFSAREFLARPKDILSCVFKPKPSFLGDKIDITKSGIVTHD